MIKLKKLNRREAIRYMGGAGLALNDEMRSLLDKYEELLLRTARPKFLYKTVDLPCEEITVGNDIKNHLDGCERAVVMCATLGAEADKLIRVTQLSDMAGAVVLDTLASVAIEQVCSEVDLIVAENFSKSYMTFRFSPGYGDYPIDLQKVFLRMLDAQKKIGLNENESHLLIPSKSVTAVAGLSENPVERKKRGCAICNMRDRCEFRKIGEHCGF